MTIQTIFDLNPNAKQDYWKFETTVVCKKCSKQVNGSIIIRKEDLRVADSSGFMLFRNGIICDDCVRSPNK